MGLSVCIYKNIELANEENYDFEAFVIDKNWEYKIKNLENHGLYKGDLCNIRVSYAYSSHGRFRESLVRLISRDDLLIKGKQLVINWQKLEKEIKMPFYELINFADNEGCLDFEISQKLYNNFVEWKDKAMDFYSHDEYYKNKYCEWLNIFEKGKDKGVVVFG